MVRMDCLENQTECNTRNAEANADMSTMIEIGMYLVCFFVGGPLNVVSFMRSVKARSLQKAPSSICLLRFHLNIADLLTLFIYVPKQVIWLLTYQWYGGDILCRVCCFFNTFCFYLHSFVIAIIAIDRVFGAYNISSVTAHRRAHRRVSYMLIVAWVVSALLSIPQMIIFRLAHPFENFTQCVAIWMSYKHEAYEVFMDPNKSNETKADVAAGLENIMYYEKLYSNVHLAFVFVIPTTIIIISYIAVIFILRGFLKDAAAKDSTQRNALLVFVPQRNANAVEEESTAVQHLNERPEVHRDDESTVTIHTRSPEVSAVHTGVSPPAAEKKKKKRQQYSGFAADTINRARQEAKRQAALILLAYIICWSPYNVLAILNATGAAETFETRDFITFLNGLITANPIVNPIIYGVFRAKVL